MIGEIMEEKKIEEMLMKEEYEPVINMLTTDGNLAEGLPFESYLASFYVGQAILRKEIDSAGGRRTPGE
ncbi:MAG: hypothetical protein ACOC7K_01240 [bacterium]